MEKDKRVTKHFLKVIGGASLALMISTPAFAEPAFHKLLSKAPAMANYMYSNQIQQESKVQDGRIFTRQHPGATAENGFGQVLQIAFADLAPELHKQKVSAYWTFQIRLARKNPKSKWHKYAITLPTGIQTIKRKKPERWMGERVTSWSSSKEFKVFVY